MVDFYYIGNRPTVEYTAKDLVHKFMTKSKGCTELVDVSREPSYSKNGIDFIIKTGAFDKYFGVTTRTDTYGVNSVFCEFVTVGQDKVSTFFYTNATLLFYYFVKTNRMAVITMPKFREWVLHNMSLLRCGEMSKGNTKVYGAFIPLNRFKDAFGPVKFIDIRKLIES